MRLSTTAVLACAAIALAGCSGDNAPASPPTPTEPLTTSSPTTVDTDMATVTATAQPPVDPVETTAAVDGPPEMPDEAREDSEAGAEAFALHYIDLINYTGMYPEVGLLEPLATDDCAACANFEATVERSATQGEYLQTDLWQVSDSVALYQGAAATAQVRVMVDQRGLDVLSETGDVIETVEEGRYAVVFDMTHEGGWKVDEIATQEAP